MIIICKYKYKFLQGLGKTNFKIKNTCVKEEGHPIVQTMQIEVKKTKLNLL